MMEEKEIFRALKELRKIKPDKNWAFLKKREILGPEVQIFPFFKPAYAGIFLILIFAGIFQFSQRALPGDFLYPVKKFTEKVQTVFVSEEEKPKVVLDLTKKRAEELAEVAQKNEVKKLAPAIKEFQATAFEAANVLVKSKEVSKKDLQKALSTLQTVKKVEETLGTDVSPQQWNKVMVNILIEECQNKSLTEKEKEILNSAKEDLEKGEVEKAFEKAFPICQNENE